MVHKKKLRFPEGENSWKEEVPKKMEPPKFKDVIIAQRQIRPFLPRTPLFTYPAINNWLGMEVYIKHENYQPVGAFKVRGGINLISQLNREERDRGVIAASTGNHGQSIAYAAKLFQVRAKIVVPEKANPGKVAAMEGWGAEVIFHGKNYDEARIYCEKLAAQYGYRYIHSGDEPLLIAGVATIALEMLEEQPDLQVLIVPIGGGSGAAGACLVAKTINPEIKVIGVQAEASPAAYYSWRQKRLVEAANETFAEGLATGTAFALPQAMLRESLDDFILLKEEEIKRAMAWMITQAHTLAEAAGAAPLGAAYRLREELRGRKVGLVCTGGNTSLTHLQMALESINEKERWAELFR